MPEMAACYGTFSKFIAFYRNVHISGRCKSKETDSGGFITKEIPIFMFIVSKNLKQSLVLEYIFAFSQKKLFFIRRCKFKKSVFFL